MSGEKSLQQRKENVIYSHSKKNGLKTYDLTIVYRETTITKMTVFCNVVTPLSETPIKACFYRIDRRRSMVKMLKLPN